MARPVTGSPGFPTSGYDLFLAQQRLFNSCEFDYPESEPQNFRIIYPIGQIIAPPIIRTKAANAVTPKPMTKPIITSENPIGSSPSRSQALLTELSRAPELRTVRLLWRKMLQDP